MDNTPWSSSTQSSNQAQQPHTPIQSNHSVHTNAHTEKSGSEFRLPSYTEL